MIEVKKLTKKYYDKAVVNSVDLKIKDQALTALIGPNGAGKSTLLGMMSRLLEKNSGEVLIHQKRLSEWSDNELAKTLSILKQNNQINMKLTVKELVSFGRFPYSQGKLSKNDDAMIEKALDYMQLKPIEHAFINELSGGQKQRAYIAMIIAQDTKYIFLDEPLNNLDMKHAKEMMQLIRKLVDDLNKTVVIVLHDINFASVYADYIVAMQDGKVVAEGLSNEIICTETLNPIYDMTFDIQTIKNKKLCLYY